MAPDSAGAPRPASKWWLAMLLIPLVEVLGHVGVQARVPEESDWTDAASFVRGERRDGDAIGVAPAWADPILRLHLGDLISLADAGRHDLAPYERLWVLSIRGHRSPEEPAEGEPELERTFGAVTVRRWALGASPVRYDFVEHVTEAQVAMTERGVAHDCPLRRGTPFGGSGLFQGPMQPAERFVCDPGRGWLWVGRTVMEDLHIRPRTCVWNHPLGEEPIRTTFRDVPLGTHLVLYGGLYYIHEREISTRPVTVAVSVNGEEVGRMTHHDGDGFKRLVALTRPHGGPARGMVSFEVTSPDPYVRSFCWAATTRSGPRAEER